MKFSSPCRHPAFPPVAILVMCFAFTVSLPKFTTAATPEIPNPDFEKGKHNPVGWSVVSGEGEWKDTGSDRGRVLAISGDGKGGVRWHSSPLEFEPGAVYELSFSARSVDANGSSMISGPRFGNEDHDLPSDEWKRYRSLFVVPDPGKTSWSKIRLGGWKLNGTLLFDNVELHRIRPLYNGRNQIKLGEGEMLRDREYHFRAPFGKRAGSHSRPLEKHHCRFHSSRWWFDPGSSVVYRHVLNGIRQKSASVQITSNYRQSGKLLVEGRGDSGDWHSIGTISEEGTHQFDLPSTIFPAKQVWVRMRAPTGRSVSLQVHNYSYESTVENTGRNLSGTTYFLKILRERKPLRVRVNPGDRLTVGNRIRARVTNRSNQTVQASWSGLAKTRNRKSKNWSSDPQTFEPGEQTVSVPFHLAGPGQNTVRLRLGEYFDAQVRVNLPPLYRSDYGHRIATQEHENVELWWCKGGWKVSRRRPVPSGNEKPLTIRSAQNEAEAAQLVLHPDQPLKNVRLDVESLDGPGNAELSAKQIDLLRVRYVNVTQPTDEAGEAAPWPDPLPSIEKPFTVPKDQNQPVWIRVKVPDDQKAGHYRGHIHLRGNDFETTVPINVHVFGFRLPDRMTLTTSFGFQPGLVWQYQNLDNRSQRKDVLQKYWSNLSEHHISPYDPAPMAEINADWPDTDDPEKLDPDMDFSRWDERISRGIERYHFNSIRLNPPGLGGGSFHNRRAPSMLGYEEGTPQYRAALNNYYRKLETHLRKKGWLDEAYVYWFDEPQPKDYDFVMNGFQKLKRAAPGLRRMLTEEVNEELIGGPSLWCPLLPRYDHERAQERRKHGESFWWYICTAPKTPYVGLFIDRPATDLRVWLWQTWKRNIDGILVWRINYWTSSAAYPNSLQNPYEDTMSWQSGYSAEEGDQISWGNGDGRFLYPPEEAADGHPDKPVLKGPVDSIRWEMLRDGIEDYEYLAILKRLLSRNRAALSEEKRNRYASLLNVPPDISVDRTHFTKDPRPIKKRRARIAQAIEQLKKQDTDSEK